MFVFLYTHNIYIYTHICSLRDPSHSIATARRQRHNRKEEMKIIGQCSCSLLSGRLWVAIGRLWVALGRLWELLGGSGSSWAALGRLLASSWAAWAAPGGSGSSWAAFGQFLDDSWAALGVLGRLLVRQKNRKRTGMTRLGSPGLSSQSISGFLGREGPGKPRNGLG